MPYFFNTKTKVSSWSHPEEAKYVQKVEEVRAIDDFVLVGIPLVTLLASLHVGSTTTTAGTAAAAASAAAAERRQREVGEENAQVTARVSPLFGPKPVFVFVFHRGGRMVHDPSFVAPFCCQRRHYRPCGKRDAAGRPQHQTSNRCRDDRLDLHSSMNFRLPLCVCCSSPLLLTKMKTLFYPASVTRHGMLLIWCTLSMLTT
jgi:hypothetical protein